MSNRNWDKEKDQILLETVLKHIRNGSTQLKAFEEAAAKLNKTAAACGFRWNNYVRKFHENDIQRAKGERKIKKKLENHVHSDPNQKSNDRVRTKMVVNKISTHAQMILELTSKLGVAMNNNTQNVNLEVEYNELKKKYDQLVEKLSKLIN